MELELRDKWTAALRSGRYKQGTSVLHSTTHGTWCCLGVLCDVARPDGWDGRQCHSPHEESSNAFLKGEQQRELGIDWRQMTKLAKMNDTGNDFFQIADQIERMFPNAPTTPYT